MFSAALCRGLIEALRSRCRAGASRRRFPRLYAAASLKRRTRCRRTGRGGAVFRGFMPRPH